MNILGCLDAPTAGEYFLEGYDVASLNDNQLSDIRNRYIGFIFQGFNLIAGLTALENVELPLIYRGMRRDQRHKAAIESLERVGLGNRMHHRPAEMSGGQQQRVAIARAIAAHPPLILADEPTGNLDTVSGMEVINTLLDLNNEGRTVILSPMTGYSLACQAYYQHKGWKDNLGSDNRIGRFLTNHPRPPRRHKPRRRQIHITPLRYHIFCRYFRNLNANQYLKDTAFQYKDGSF